MLFTFQLDVSPCIDVNTINGYIPIDLCWSVKAGHTFCCNTNIGFGDIILRLLQNHLAVKEIPNFFYIINKQNVYYHF